MNKQSVVEFKAKSSVFHLALLSAEYFSTDEIFSEFEKLDYPSFGFGGVMIFKSTNRNYWEAALRNPKDFNDPQIDCSGHTVKNAVSRLYAWCVYKRYLPYLFPPGPECERILQGIANISTFKEAVEFWNSIVEFKSRFSLIKIYFISDHIAEKIATLNEPDDKKLKFLKNLYSNRLHKLDLSNRSENLHNYLGLLKLEAGCRGNELLYLR